MAATAAVATDPGVTGDAAVEATVPAGAAAGSSLPLALRIFLLTALLVTLAVAASVAVTWFVGERIARSAVATALDSSVDAQRSLSRQRLSVLERTIQLIASDPDLGNYVAAAFGDDLGIGPAAAPDSRSIRDLLRERQAQYGFDLGLVLDTGGILVARSDETEAFSADLADDPLVAPALAAATPVSGFWRHEEQLFQAAIMPLTQGPSLVGYLLLAQRVDDVLAGDIARGSDAQAAFWLPGADGPALVASSLDEAQAQRLAQRFRETTALVDALQLGQPVERIALEVAGERWLARLTPTAGEGNVATGAVMALASTTAAASGYRQILDLVLIAGSASLLLALLLSLWLSRRILRPVEQLADAAERAAAGDYQASTAVAGRDALARLGRALDSLLSDLRARRDIEGYVSTFSRFVPDAQEAAPVASAIPAPDAGLETPRRNEAVLLGIELPAASGDEGATAATAARLAAQLQELAQLCGGRLAAGDGERFTLAFDGPQRLEHALQAARGALTELGSDALRPALALAEGDVDSAVVMVDRRLQPLVLGSAGRQVFRLLCESAPGRALIARPLGDRIRERFGTEALEVAAGVLGGRRYYALRVSGLDSLEQPRPVEQDAALLETRALPAVAVVAGDELRPGMRFGGRYEILATLGKGGMGIVYKARDLELADVVALKMLHPEALGNREQMERLKDEIRLARRITHPNVLRTFDFGEVGGQPYISMEYVRGVTLRDLLDQSGRLPYSAGLRIARQLGAGLAAAHEVGVLHRDIKPENLMLEASGTARLMDFGIARPARRERPGATQPGMFVGTPHYCAPEQLAGEEVDERADIYACGALMSEMFCGGLPYVGNTTMEIYLAQVRQEPVRPSELWPEVPVALERIILRCIARRREDRFQDAGALGTALAGLRA